MVINKKMKENFKKVDQKQSFPKLEEEILKFWQENDTFKKSIKIRENSPEFNFYDWPPFATGKPHYGHILASTIKDVVPRYQTMKGYKVDRKFGWDTHGLPIENIVEKKLEINWIEDIENKIWVHKFNETCRENVFIYEKEWRKTIDRMGRWVDMDNDYKTMDTSFMESVWWVYKSLYEKGLIYEGYRVVPYCPRCSTPLSNFEVNQWYKDIQDKTITVKFKVKWNESKYILAWTTTPWTLPSNLWLAVWENIEYSEVKEKETGDTIILATSRISAYFKDEESYEIVRNYMWNCLAWAEYEPIFNDFQLLNEAWNMPQGMELLENSYKVVIGHHVTDDSGTGIVHIAPAYWEDDYQIWKDQKLGFVSHISDNWKVEHLFENVWNEVFDFNEKAVTILKEQNKHFKIDTYVHSYPHCWRCDSKLIYRAISAWYVNVESIRDKMVANNQKVNWTPDIIKNWRFWTWVENAKDWNISRNRYWGSAIPVWQNEDKTEEVCIGSIEELYQKNKDYGQMTKIIFVRHGRTDYNEKGLMDYENKANLTEIWKNQAEELAKIFEDEKIDAIYSSPLDRCCDTISPLAKSKNLEINKIDNLREIESPELQDKTFSCKDYKWENGFGWWEKISEVYDRVKKSLEKIIEENKWKTVVVCSHWDPSFLARMALNDNIDYDNEKYSCGKYLENNPEKYDISAMYWVEYVNVSNKKAMDIHKHFVDEIFVKSESGTKLKRVPEVLDCWFESGSMPYASKHYPFEWTEDFKFPADFIAEWLDQTRGWFYTLLILGTALFDKAPFKNVIVNWIVLAEDGQKMSKSKQNYPAPELMFDKYWVDAVRFYLMNSPVVEAQDFRFAENWVEEVVKKVILPLWNTYSFFTTYANIDGFKPKKDWKIFYMRHGQTEANLAWIMSWWDDDSNLTKKWISEAIFEGKKFANSGVKLDKIFCTSRQRSKDTAKYVAENLGYDVEIEIIDDLNEQISGKFKGMSHKEIALQNNLKDLNEIRQAYKEENWIENIDAFEERVLRAFNKIKEENIDKNVLIVAHSGTLRPINRYLNNLTKQEAHFEAASAQNAKIFELPSYQKNNKLDRWIISELNKLNEEVTKSFDNYKLNEAARPIVEFMDNLTNWYIRRSRKRFWKSEDSQDKLEAYNTLYDVLVELTKIIAPFMPFISDSIFKDLTWKESVHLENFSNYVPGFIFNELNLEMDKTQKIINLWMAWRVNNKLRVRQPLASITIGENLSDYYKEIIKEELNVKNVIVLEDASSIAKKVCRPNGRAIWPKFWKDVKFIISEAKAWNFEELNSWNVKVWDFELEEWDFELVFEKSDDSLNIEAWFWMVITMDWELTKDLIEEWVARDIVRFIQEARKEANFDVSDRIQLELSNEVLESIWEYKSYIENETLSKIVESLKDFDLEKEVETWDIKWLIKIKK